MTLKELARDIHENAKAHGWWDAQFSNEEIAVVSDALERHPNLRAKVIEKLREERTFGDIAALCHSELSEALEEHRNGTPLFYFITEIADDKAAGGSYPARRDDPTDYCGEKPEGIAVEMADCLIRILDWCGKEGIDIDEIVRIKHEYNKSRPYKHGGKRC